VRQLDAALVGGIRSFGQVTAPHPCPALSGDNPYKQRRCRQIRIAKPQCIEAYRRRKASKRMENV